MKTSQQEKNDMQDLIIKFDGEANYIKANTLINSLIHFNHLLETISRKMDSTKSVEISVKAFAPGSFLVDLALSTKQAIGNSNLLSKENIGYAKEVVKTVVETYKILKFLKGEKPKSTRTNGQTISIENNYGVVNNFDLTGATIYLEGKEVRNLLSNSFETIDNDPNITSFELLDKNKKPLIQIEKNEFINLATFEDDPLESKTEKIKIIENAIITLFSFDWGMRKKWDFYYEGTKIPIKILDETFLKAINKGEAFAKGDALLVDLEIKQEWDLEANVFVNKSYYLKKYIKHILRDEQSKLNFPPI